MSPILRFKSGPTIFSANVDPPRRSDPYVVAPVTVQRIEEAQATDRVDPSFLWSRGGTERVSQVKFQSSLHRVRNLGCFGNSSETTLHPCRWDP